MKRGQTELTERLPLQPPSKLWRHEKVKKALSANALIYRVGWVYDPYEECKKKMAKIHCTACGETFYYPLARKESCGGHTYYGIMHPNAEEIFSGECCLCPECGAPVKAVHVSDFGRDTHYLLASTYPITCAKIGKHLALISWRILKGTDKEGNVEIKTFPFEAYISEGKKVVRCVGYWKYFSTIRWTGEWEQRARASDEYGMIQENAFIPPTAAELRGTEMENSKITEYMQGGRWPIAYMMIFLKHPNIENLIVQGCGGLVDELITKCHQSNNYYGPALLQKDLRHIDWKKARPCEMLGMTKQEFDYFKRNCFSIDGLERFALLRKYDECAAIQRVPVLLGRLTSEIEECLVRNVLPEKAFRYLERQRKKYRSDRIGFYDLRDYWRMAEELKEDLGDPRVRWPQRISTAHDQMVERINLKEDELEAEGFKKRFDELEKYIFEKDGLLIRPARTRSEFRAEGKRLHHCVATYADRHKSGQTAIFFIRRTSDPNAPYFTLEYNEKGGYVCQNRGLNNCARTEDVVAFEAAWLEHIVKIKRRVKNGKSNRTAKRSAAGAA